MHTINTEREHVHKTPEIVPWKWPAVLQSGLITGTILLLLPQGQPWAVMNAFSGVVMGRLPNVEGTGISWGGVAVHLLLAAAYSFIVIPVARLWRVWRGIMVGCLMGLVCYGLNWTLAHFLVPSYEGQEGRVLLTHLLFGLFVTAIYKGLTIERVRGIQQTP